MTNQDKRPMDPADPSADSWQDLRQKADAQARERAVRKLEDGETLSPEKIQKTLHELQVHQIELEMQNEELRMAQAEIETGRERYLDLYDLAPVGYCTLSEKGIILEANLTSTTLLGTTRDMLVKQPISRFILNDDQDIYSLHRKKLFETGNPQECELRLVKPGGALIWVHLTATATQTNDGESVSRLVINDMTERKQAEAEREKLQAQLTQAQKMESVGRLAGGVAHDFNNMLGAILGYTELCLNKTAPSHPLFGHLRQIQKAAERSTDLTRQLLAFASRQTVAPKVLDLNEIVNDTLKMLRRLIGEDMDLAWRPWCNLGSVFIDPSQVDQILTNLCVNARDAIADTGKITIETASVSFDEAYCADHADFIPGEFVMLAVSDDGCGMDAETLSHLFEPFFSTKKMNKGTGLGLAMVYGVVKQNNGFINVYSEPGHGTTFKIYLPQHSAKADPRSEQEQAPAAVTDGETILLVEDEPALLEVTTMMLKEMGYGVIAAGSPGKAIRLAREYLGRIDLLMTDVVMPEMNGRDLAGNLMSIYPDIRCLFMSGYTANVIARHGVLDPDVHFLQKPFSLQDMVTKIREALDREEATRRND